MMMNSIVSSNFEEEEDKNEHMNLKNANEDSEDIHMKKPRIFKYELNEKKAKTKLLKGAMKPKHMDIEVKSTCVNMRFDGGSFKEVVLPLLSFWSEKDEGSFEFMGTTISVVESD